MTKPESKYALKKARQLGEDAFRDRPTRSMHVHPSSRNPFALGTPKHVAWSQGWEEARSNHINSGDY